MNFTPPPGLAGTIVTELAEMVPAPREALVMGAYLTLASTLYGRRFKDGYDPINLFIVTAAHTFAGKSRMVTALTTALQSGVVGWDADPEDMSGRVTTSGINARPRLFSETPYATAPQIHSELVRTGSQCFLVDEFRSTLQAMVSNFSLADYLTRAWGSGMAVRSLAQLDRKAGTVGDGGGAVGVYNPNVTIWGLCHPLDLPGLDGDFWARWLILRDETKPTVRDDVRAPWTCRAAFSREVGEWLRNSVKKSDAVDSLYAMAAIQDPEGRRAPVTMPESLAELQRTAIVPIGWDDAALGELSGLSGREMTLARRIACLITATNSGHIFVVGAEVAKWSVAFVRRWSARRTPPRAIVVTRDVLIAVRFLRQPRGAVITTNWLATALAVEFKGQGVPRFKAAALEAVADLRELGAIEFEDMDGQMRVRINSAHPIWSGC